MPVRADADVHREPLYRHTFLRQHVPEQLDRRIDDVLALQSIEQRLMSQFSLAFRAKHRRANTEGEKKAFNNWLRRTPLCLKAFFRGDDPVSPEFPDTIVYRPVPVFEFGDPVSEGWTELSALLVDMARDRDDRGVILRARSGAGKTVGQVKAFCDCAWGARDRDDPQQTLAGRGHVACWLNVGDVPDGDESLIERMLLRHAGVSGSCSLATLKLWLEGGRPRVLVFCDLNAASEVKPNQSRAESARRRLARGLEKFQIDHGRGGHRCVVAYRSSRSGDEIVNQLAGSFRSIDMRPLGLADATAYLRDYREFEARVIARVESHEHGGPGLVLLREERERDIEAEVKVLVDLIRRYGRPIRSTPDSDVIEDEWAPESVISTPLLMHFVSSLTGDELRARVGSLTDLYRLVINQHIKRDVEEYGKNQKCPELADLDRARPRIIAAMTRVALAIRERGAGSTRLPHDDLVKLFKHPRLDAPKPSRPSSVALLGNPGRLWSTKRSPYYWLDPVESPEDYQRTLQEFSLLRSDVQSHGFLHDSMIDFFQGLALRDYEGNGAPERPQKSWYAATVVRIRNDVPRHRRCLEFLGGLLDASAAESLLWEFLAVEPVPPEWPDLLRRLTNGASTTSAVAAAIHRMTLFRSTLLRRVPSQLASQVYAHLYDNQSDRLSAFAARLARRLKKAESPRSWLRLDKGSLSLHDWVMAEHSATVNDVAALPDGRIASCSTDGTVRLWDPASDEAPVISRHNSAATGLAVLPDGRVASAWHDGTVRLWGPDGGEDQVIIQHDYRVTALVVLPDGRIASGSDDGTVRLWEPGGGLGPVITQLDAGVLALAVLCDGRIASGWHDGTVRLWDPASGEAAIITTHDDIVCALAVLPDGRIASASRGDTVRLWGPSRGESAVITQRDGSKDALVALPDGRIASGSQGYTVRVWDPASGESAVVIEHEAWVSALAVLPDGRVASGSGDHTVRLWDSAAGEAPVVIRHDGSVTVLAVLPNGCIASGSGDNTVRIWDPANGEAPANTHHSRLVAALAVLPDGRVVSSSADKTVRIWDPASGEASVITRHDRWVRFLTVLPDGRIASGSDDNVVRIWGAKRGEVTLTSPHNTSINGLAVLPDGHYASASADGTVRLWHPASKKAAVIIQHNSIVSGVALLPDGRIASSSWDKTVRLWDPDTGASQIITEHDDGVEAVVLLPDGRIASGSWDKTVRVTDPATGKSSVITEHDDRVLALAVLRDGRIASGSADKTVRISNLRRRRSRAQDTLAFAFTSAVQSLAVDPRNGHLAVGLTSGRILIFAIEPEANLNA
jgi:WD40 repeat protein